MERINLIKILNGDIDLIDHVNVKDIAAFSKDDVVIRPWHVRKMLMNFLTDKIDALDINKWATFICLRTEYVCVSADIDPLDEKYDEVADYYEDMMYVIQKLSTPEIDGEINKKSVQQYLSELDKYKVDKYQGFFKQ